MRKSPVSATAMLLLAGVVLAPGLSAAADAKDPVYPGKAATMKVNGQLQFRYTFIDNEHGVDESASGFAWKRARLTFSGDLTENLYYQWRWQGDNLPESISFSTTFLGYHLGPIGDLELGRFDVECTPRSSSSRQPMAERPFHVERNKAGAQLGAHYAKDWFDERIMVDLGVYNGNGDHNADIGNDNSKFMWAARLSLSPNKNFDYNTGTDLNHSDWGVGFLGGYWITPNRNSSSKVSYETTASGTPPTYKTSQITTTTRIDNKVSTMGAALYVRGKGLFLTGEYTIRTATNEGRGSAERSDGKAATPKVSDFEKYEFKSKGLSLTAAYSIPLPIKGHFIEPTIRYETYKDTNKKTDPEGNFAWTTVGVNYYLKKYDAGFNVDYVIKRERGAVESISNNELQIQGNLYF